jgi:hypothetical protein
LGIPTGADGRPVRQWAICEVEAPSFSEFDGDNDLVALADRLDLDAVPTGGQRNRINNLLSRLGATTRADAGETHRVIANQLLAELGSEERV